MTILMSLVIWSFPISMQEIMGTPVLFMVHLKIILTKHWKLPTPLKGFLPHQNPSVLLSFLAMLPKLLQEAGIRFQTALSNCRNPLPIPIFVFESLTYQEKEIAVHADIEDHEQSIYFPGIGTTAKDKADGDQEAVATKEVTIIDTVSYQNLIPDTPYKLVGTLMDKTTQKEVMIDGKPVTAETEFTPKDSNGSVEVIFTFDGSTLAGHDVVVFEKLFSLEGETALEIASHEDLDDKGQTIKLTEAPKDTPEPSKPVKTGDETTVLPYLLLAGAALLFAAGFGILYIRKRKKDK